MGDTQRQINQLREQVETLMRERVKPAVTDVPRTVLGSHQRLTDWVMRWRTVSQITARRTSAPRHH